MRGISSGRVLALLGATVVAGLATQASVALAVVPTVATQSATGVMIQAATLRGTVNPRSLATSYFFQYGPTSAYGAQTAPASLAAGAAAVRVTGAAGALVPATTYHFRLVATNATGTSVTADRTFRTPAQALRVALAATPNPTAFGGPTTLVGAVTGRLVDFQRLEQVVEPAGEVLPEHVPMVRVLFAAGCASARTAASGQSGYACAFLTEDDYVC